jgi:endonuclease/exonuclease/phosphatase family metal-dependent hydrolase
MQYKKIGIFCLAVVLAYSPIAAQLSAKFMSYNIRLDFDGDGDNKWSLRKEKLVGLLRYHNADFMGMQEVMHNQLMFIDSALDNYSFIGVGRDDGATAGEYSPILYNPNNYNLLQHNTFWLSATPDSVSFGWDAVCRRVCTYGLFQHKKTKQQFWVFNTHFDHVGKEARRKSAALILQKIKELNTKNLPIILLGDFNAKPTDEPYTIIAQQLTDVRSKAVFTHGNNDTWNAFQFAKKPNGVIDHIFTNAHPLLHIQQFATLTDSYDMKYYSDHFPIVSVVHFLKK